MEIADLTPAIGFVIAIVLLLGSSWLIRRWPRLRFALLSLPCLLGVLIAYSALTAPHGYVVPYSFAAAWIFAILLGLAGIVLLVVPSCRRTGLGGLAAGTLLLLSFYGVYLTGYGLGLHSWKQKVRITSGTMAEPR